VLRSPRCARDDIRLSAISGRSLPLTPAGSGAYNKETKSLREGKKMSWGLYALLIAFGLFILLLILNPRISCFGKYIRSPFYPLLRKKPKKEQVKVEDYGFHLVEGETKELKREPDKKEKTAKKAEDYGFK
jgi:hypothetical protein